VATTIDQKRVVMTLIMSVSLSAGYANAACDRPGTPDQVSVSRPGRHSVTLFWRSTARENVWFDIAITRNGVPVKGYTGVRGMRGLAKYHWEDQRRINNLQEGSTYCFRMKARTASGSNGCVSAQWSNEACVKTLRVTPPLFTDKEARESVEKGKKDRIRPLY